MYTGIYDMIGNSDAAAKAMKEARDLSNDPAVPNAGLLTLGLEENNRALIDEYLALTRNQVMHTLLDKPEEAGSELRLILTDPAYSDPMNRLGIAVWASYFGEHELALQIFRETGLDLFIWRPIHKGMRQLPGFKDLVREFGLVDYWRATGKWGDFCRPIGDDDFECD